ncbi:DUF2480 family protein [Ornithobacterium rhinotracheale]|uniref:DUF2480 family protein n=1 Tax=Ornithobacterium rhinotracheale TaxID=28251 RepID=UPI00129C287D|nr:DUF2480 family protein [Ornithobacterium rhinotracheale]MRJ09529.1 DUF2480 family protein [Ornithobacterium rhinotracheale]
MNDIVNRVANSSLRSIDLEHIFTHEIKPFTRVLDLQELLGDAPILIERDFRKALSQFDWAGYKNQYVHLTSSNDLILPGWTFMLVQCHLLPYAKFCGLGSFREFTNAALQHFIQHMSLDELAHHPIIIKGCGNLNITEQTHLTLINRLFPIAKSLMYGEACSTVPLYKKK